jgi:acid phosphatase family membrane protein YuiD
MAWVQVLNQIVFELPPEHPLADTRPLREFLGHTPPQVSFPFLAFSSRDLKGLGKSL